MFSSPVAACVLAEAFHSHLAAEERWKPCRTDIMLACDHSRRSGSGSGAMPWTQDGGHGPREVNQTGSLKTTQLHHTVTPPLNDYIGK